VLNAHNETILQASYYASEHHVNSAANYETFSMFCAAK